MERDYIGEMRVSTMIRMAQANRIAYHTLRKAGSAKAGEHKAVAKTWISAARIVRGTKRRAMKKEAMA